MKMITKLFIGLIVIGVLTIMTGLVGTLITNQFGDEIYSYKNEQVPRINLLTRFRQTEADLANTISTILLLKTQLILLKEISPDIINQQTSKIDTENKKASDLQIKLQQYKEQLISSTPELSNSIKSTVELVEFTEKLLAIPITAENTLNIIKKKEQFESIKEKLRAALEQQRNATISNLNKQQNDFENINNHAKQAIQISSLVIFISIIILVLFFKYRLSNPLIQLIHGVKAVRRGDYNTYIDINSQDEIGQLVKVFNQMTHAVKQLIEDRDKATLAERKRADQLAQTNNRLKDVQQSLVQSSKLASIGELASGVGHELNNPLFVVVGAAEQIRMLIEDSESLDFKEIESLLDMIDSHCDRMEVIINHLRKFSRKSEESFSEVNINNVIQSSFTLLSQQLILRNIQVIRALSEEKPRVLGDPNLLEQVLINLLNNARDAVEMLPKDATDRFINVISEIRDNNVIIKVADSGPGIPEEIKSKIFDAFFSTKEVGKGTGLGLSISHSIIVDQHQGSFDVQSEPNRGTIFTISIPEYKDQ